MEWEIDTDLGGYQIFRGHDIGDPQTVVRDKAQIAIGNDSGQFAVMQYRQT